MISHFCLYTQVQPNQRAFAIRISTKKQQGMHIVHLGFLRDVVASCLVDMLESGPCIFRCSVQLQYTTYKVNQKDFKLQWFRPIVAHACCIFQVSISSMFGAGDLHSYVGLNSDASADHVMYRVGSMAQIWATEHKLELSIRALTESSLYHHSSTYPLLDTQIKAARTRTLFEFVCKICLDVEPRCVPNILLDCVACVFSPALPWRL